MLDSWLLLIYTVPADPSRLRATVWREIKKAGAIYLRDGVCALPDQPSYLEMFQAIESKVKEFGGVASLARGARLDGERVEVIIEAASEARKAEYEDILREVERFRAHVRREREHREFTFGELQELEADVSKLQRWAGQVKQRDFMGLDEAGKVEAALGECEAELSTFMEQAFENEERTL